MKKHALVLSGGGSRGSYQVGVLRGLDYLGRLNGGFGFISGTSVGAINALGLAHHTPEQISEAVDWLYDLWTQEIKGTRSIWKWKFPHLLAGLWNQSVGTQKPLEKLLRRVVRPALVRDSGIQLRMPAVDIETGHRRVFDQDFPDIVAAALASSSFPTVFEPVAIEGVMYTDGGLVDIAPLHSAIMWGAERITVVLTRDPANIHGKQRYPNVVEFSKAMIDIMSTDVMVNDLLVCHRTNEEVSTGKRSNKRIVDLEVFYPSQELGSSLDFGPDLMTSRISLGIADALAGHVLDLGAISLDT
jgi:NTE family protein